MATVFERMIAVRKTNYCMYTLEQLLKIAEIVDRRIPQTIDDGLDDNLHDAYRAANQIITWSENADTVLFAQEAISEINKFIVEKSNASIDSPQKGERLIKRLFSNSGSQFVIRQYSSGCAFVLKGSDGQILGTSEMYSKKSSCLLGVESIIRNSQADIEDTTAEQRAPTKSPKFTVYVDRAGEYRYRLVAKNGEAILASEGYKTKDACLRCIASVKKAIPVAEIVNG